MDEQKEIDCDFKFYAKSLLQAYLEYRGKKKVIITQLGIDSGRLVQDVLFYNDKYIQIIFHDGYKVEFPFKELGGDDD